MESKRRSWIQSGVELGKSLSAGEQEATVEGKVPITKAQSNFHSRGYYPFYERDPKRQWQEGDEQDSYEWNMTEDAERKWRIVNRLDWMRTCRS